MKILLTTSAEPQKSPFCTDEKRPPLGIGSLIAILRNDGQEVCFIDNYLKPSKFIEEGYLQNNHIDIIGVYSNTICYQDTLRMLNKIQEIRNKGLWGGKIIVGGPHTSVALESIPKFVDHIIQGEGETAILKIIHGETQSRVLKEERIQNLDKLPFQPWDIFTEMPYDFTCPWMNIEPVFTMNTSRGCPFHCEFCSVESIWGRKYTYFSADRIISEIEYLIKNYGAKGIYFREDNFTLSSQRVFEFCEKLIKKGIKIQWACETRVDTISEPLIKLMHDAGCKAVYLGIESGSQKVLDRLNKKITPEQIEDAILLFKKYHINTYCSLITGIPGETYEDYVLTKDLMNKLKPTRYSFNIFVGIPKSSLYDYVLKNHLYEYIDELGLVYLPGYNIKCKFFYGTESTNFVEYQFKKITEYDKRLLKEMGGNQFFMTKSWLKKLLNKLRRIS